MGVSGRAATSTSAWSWPISVWCPSRRRHRAPGPPGDHSASIDHIMAISKRRIRGGERRGCLATGRLSPVRSGFVHTQALGLEQSGVSYYTAPRSEHEDIARDNLGGPAVCGCPSRRMSAEGVHEVFEGVDGLFGLTFGDIPLAAFIATTPSHHERIGDAAGQEEIPTAATPRRATGRGGVNCPSNMLGLERGNPISWEGFMACSAGDRKLRGLPASPGGLGCLSGVATTSSASIRCQSARSCSWPWVTARRTAHDYSAGVSAVGRWGPGSPQALGPHGLHAVDHHGATRCPRNQS